MERTLENYQIHGTTDFLIIHADSRFDNELEITGENGQKIKLASDGEYEDKFRCWGTVVATPRRLTPERIMFSDGDKPVRMNEIQLDVNPGEKIYFSYLALQDSMEVAPDHYAVAYSDAIAVIRNGELIPIGSHVLLKPVYPDDCIEVEKGIYGRQNSFGMITELNVPPKPYEAIVMNTGKPLKYRECFLLAGQRVGIDKYFYGPKITIEGEEYLVCRQHNIAWLYTD